MMKKLLFLLLLVISTGALAQNFTDNGINFTVTDPTNFKVAVASNTGFTGVANIPATVTYNSQSYDVISFGANAFSNCTGLTSVTIPNSVTTIETFAFSGCSSLTTLVIPSSVTSIKRYAFRNCSSLTTFVIPNSLTSIIDSTFSGCSSLTSVTIPNSVTTIELYAFENCTSLTTLTIPSSVTSFGFGAFTNCFGLTTINCYIQNPISISGSIFQGVNQSACALNVNDAAAATAYEAAAFWTDFNPINGVLANDTFAKNNFSMYPNPSNGVFTINIQEDANVIVNDMLGKVIYTNKVKAGNNTIDISNYQAGIYLLNIANENGSVTKKLIKE